MTCRHSCRNMHIFTECVWKCEYGIACTFRWGVALVGDFLYWTLLTLSWENIFKYRRYTGRRNRFKKLVEKKTRFGFVLYLVNFG